MKFDKFGLGALVIGLVIVALMLQVFFMAPGMGGWTWQGLWNAIAEAVVGGVLLLGVFLVVIGLLLLFL
jgi:ABC-type dipeptide/oligopeptide/nickel transport system permease component